MAWYENNKKFDIDVSKIQPRGALAGKAIGDSFKDIAQIIDDREKTNLEKEKHDKEMALKAFEINKAEDEEKTKEASKKYERFVDDNGAFNEEGFKQAYGEDELKNVPLDVRQNRHNIENAYNKDKMSKDLGAILMSANNKEEFDKTYNSLSPEQKKNIDKDTAIQIREHYNKLKTDADKLELEKGQAKDKSSSQKQRPAADYSLVYRVIVEHYGGFYDPDTHRISGLDPETTKKVTRLLADAGKLLRENPELSTAEAPWIIIGENAKNLGATKEAKPEGLGKQQEGKPNLTKADNKELVADKERLNKMLNLK